MSIKYKARPRTQRRLSAKDLPITRLVLLETLYDHTFDKFYIEYNGYFSNRLIQSCIALYNLGVSKEKFQSFVEHYINQLESINGPTRQKQDLGLDFSEIGLGELKGRRGGFYKIRKHYHVILADKYDDSVDALLRGELPGLLLGISALHPLEVIGYAHSINSSDLVCDGLACLYHSFSPLQLKKERNWSEFGRGSMPLRKVLEKIAGDEELNRFMGRGLKSTDVIRTRLEFVRSDTLRFLQNRADSIMDYVFKIKLPADLLKSPDECMLYVLDQLIFTYHICAIRNNTHILDLVTSAWSLSQLVPLLKDPELKIQFTCVHLCTFLATFLSLGRPELVSQLSQEPSVIGMSWDKILESVLTLPVSIDHNIYRLVQVCYLRGLKNMDIEASDIYKKACVSTMAMDGMN